MCSAARRLRYQGPLTGLSSSSGLALAIGMPLGQHLAAAPRRRALNPPLPLDGLPPAVAAVPTFIGYQGADRVTAFSGADKASAAAAADVRRCHRLRCARSLWPTCARGAAEAAVPPEALPNIVRWLPLAPRRRC